MSSNSAFGFTYSIPSKALRKGKFFATTRRELTNKPPAGSTESFFNRKSCEMQRSRPDGLVVCQSNRDIQFGICEGSGGRGSHRVVEIQAAQIRASQAPRKITWDLPSRKVGAEWIPAQRAFLPRNA